MMDYLYTPLIRSSKTNKFQQYCKKIGLNKNNSSTNQNFNSTNESIQNKYYPNFNYYNENNSKIQNSQNELNSLNNNNYHNFNSKREVEEMSEDSIIPKYKNDNYILLEGKKVTSRNSNVYLNPKLKCNENENKNKKLSKSLKQLLSRSRQKAQNNENLSTNTFSMSRSSFDETTISRQISKYNDLNNIRTLFSNLTERNLRMNNIITNDTSRKRHFSNYFLEEEYKSKMRDQKYYSDKYNELEKEFRILKNSIIEYQRQNRELKKEIYNLKNKRDNFQPIKVNVKENNRNTYYYKNNNIELILKENNKLLNENKIYRKQLEEYIKKIKDLILIIQNKDNYIKLLKKKMVVSKANINKNPKVNTENNKEQENKPDNRIIKNGNLINKSVDKLIIENEENKKKINQIFEKIKDLGNLEQEYKNYLNLSLKEKKELIIRENGSPKNNISIIKNNQKEDYIIQKNELLFINNIQENKSFKNENDENIHKNERNRREIQKIENIKINSDNSKENRYVKKSINNKIKDNNNNKIEYKKDNINKNTKEKEKEYDNEKNKEKNRIGITTVVKHRSKSQDERNNRFSSESDSQKNNKENSNKEETSKNQICSNLKDDFEQTNKEVKEEMKEKDKKRNHTHRPNYKKKATILEGIDVTEIYTSRPVRVQSSLSFLSNNNINNKYLLLFGIDKDNNFFQFDLINKKWTKQQNILNIEDLSDSFKNNYIYENSIFYNTLNGFFILTGKNTNILYYYNAINEQLIKVCQFNTGHIGGSLLLDSKYNRIFVFSGKNIKICEYFSFTEKKIYKIPQLSSDRTNASFTIHNNKIYCFFGYSSLKRKYSNTIEYIDIQKLDQWKVITKIISDFDNFYIEKMASAIFREKEPDCIYLYCGIKKSQDNDKKVEDNIVKFDTKNNKIEIVKNIKFTEYKFIGSRWRKSDLSDKFEFERNNNFLELPPHLNNSKDTSNVFVTHLESNNNKVLIDSKNNVHFLFYDSKNVEIFRCYYK